MSLKITNSNLITYTDKLLTVDILGGVDLSTVERMVCTLRITHKKQPIYRTTLDLYNESQTDKLIRTLCDKWEVKLLDVSKTIYNLTLKLEDYRLEQLKFKGQNQKTSFALSAEDQKQALKTLKSKTLLKQLTDKLNTTGIIGEDDNATILFMALASHKLGSPFSVLCLAKSGIGKSYILQKLAECMPQGSYSFHTQISANALYYFDSNDIQNKALLIEDLEWTTQMLTPLATLQSQGKLIKTRASAGLINQVEVQQAQHELRCLIASLNNVSVVNPYAPLIELPSDISHPRKSLLLLLNFIEVITYIFQRQRTERVSEETGEVYIETHPDDIELAFKLLKNSLFRRADELSTTARGFYAWLSAYLNEAKVNQFTALDIRKSKAIHPRTLNRYLQELKLYSYVKVVGGNKHRGGFIYKLTDLGNQTDVESRIETALQTNLKKIKEQFSKTDSQNAVSNSQKQTA